MMGKNLSKLTWPKAKKAFENTNLAIVPIGSHEQHGPHLPLQTDAIIADRLAKEAAKNIDCIKTPVIPIGYADYHADFPGTLSVPQPTLEKYVQSIFSYLIKYGISNIMIVNGHGGNLSALTNIAHKLRKNNGITVGIIQWWDITEDLNSDWAMIGHGDFIETSMVLAIDKESVDLEKAEIPENRFLTDQVHAMDLRRMKFKGASFLMSLRTKDVSSTGDMIEYGHSDTVDYERAKSPADATAKEGKAIIEAVGNYIRKAAKELTKISLEPVG